VIPASAPINRRGRHECEICGYRYAWCFATILLKGAELKQKRWPRRARVALDCPECGHRIVVCTWVSRGVLEAA
jgi:transcription elongation factor Elf1